MRQELKQSYLKTINPSYKKASRSEKTKILDHAELVTGLSRKRIIKILNSKKSVTLKPRGRPRLYTEDISTHIVKLYPLMERICPVRMKAAIPLWLDSYEAHDGALDDLTREKLLKVSASTIGRILSENGNFANTLTVTDVFSGWTENRACWTKVAKEIKKAISKIEDRIPFNIKFFDTDCGSEFLNYTVMEYFERSSYRDRKKNKTR